MRELQIAEQFVDIKEMRNTPLCDSLRAYIKASQEYVTGTANLKLYKGNIIMALPAPL